MLSYSLNVQFYILTLSNTNHVTTITKSNYAELQVTENHKYRLEIGNFQLTLQLFKLLLISQACFKLLNRSERGMELGSVSVREVGIINI